MIDVTENGIEAAAATAIAGALSLHGPTTFDFRADRPFIYLIRDTKSGAFLFLGRMMGPTK